ncbi:hypothetical protein [Domibacillus epiphyticus]|uniref:Uncharacterized protein n=1 Tax=Domibacillus epiphyticus TaxID=1714355 RepID=A0A1V2A6G0_9BACI|nr:hypothetical protein [Domibacillus epiphyticus]OMP66566.1 hypothetical protein BTO28_10965 [Domibacillus epiphyticus]
MKRVVQYTAMIIVAIFSYWLYLKQFGAVPFLLISFFFFYKSYEEYSGRSKKRNRTPQIDHSAPSAGKKAEIIT